jgi:hypothetical protein
VKAAGVSLRAAAKISLHESGTQVKTKKVDGVDLSAKCFAFIGDVDDTSTWKLPILFRGDEAKTRNHIKNALYRFDETKGIPQSARRDVWFTLRGAALNLGIAVPFKEFPKQDEAAVPAERPVSAAVAKKQTPSQQKAVSGSWAAWADLRADEFLKSLGLE